MSEQQEKKAVAETVPVSHREDEDKAIKADPAHMSFGNPFTEREYQAENENFQKHMVKVQSMNADLFKKSSLYDETSAPSLKSRNSLKSNMSRYSYIGRHKLKGKGGIRNHNHQTHDLSVVSQATIKTRSSLSPESKK